MKNHAYAGLNKIYKLQINFPAQMRVRSGTAMDQKRKANFVEDEITEMVEKTDARQHKLFGG